MRRAWAHDPRRGALAALLATALLAACGGDGSNGDRITAAAVARTTAKAGGVHVLETVSFPPFGLPGAKPTSMSAEGVYDFANRRGAFRVRMDVDGDPVEADVRWIGSRQYLRLTSTPGALGTLVPTTPTKPWLAMESQASQSGGGLLGSFGMETDPADVLDGLRRSATAVDVVGHERVRGAATTHERFELDPAKLPPSLVGDEAPPASTDRAVADAWVDADGRLRRLHTTLPATPALTLDIEMWDYGTDVHVEAPPADQVTPFDPTQIGDTGGTVGREGFTAAPGGGAKTSTDFPAIKLTGPWRKVASGTWHDVTWRVWQAPSDGMVCTSFEPEPLPAPRTSLPDAATKALPRHDSHPSFCSNASIVADPMTFLLPTAPTASPRYRVVAGIAATGTRRVAVVLRDGSTVDVPVDAASRVFVWFGEAHTVPVALRVDGSERLDCRLDAALPAAVVRDCETTATR